MSVDPDAPHVIAVSGSVIDVLFPSGNLPAICEAVEILWDADKPLTAEVQSHIDPHTAKRDIQAPGLRQRRHKNITLSKRRDRAAY